MIFMCRYVSKSYEFRNAKTSYNLRQRKFYRFISCPSFILTLRDISAVRHSFEGLYKKTVAVRALAAARGVTVARVLVAGPWFLPMVSL
jgi:hypothetical protein